MALPRRRHRRGRRRPDPACQRARSPAAMALVRSWPRRGQPLRHPAGVHGGTGREWWSEVASCGRGPRSEESCAALRDRTILRFKPHFRERADRPLVVAAAGQASSNVPTFSFGDAPRVSLDKSGSSDWDSGSRDSRGRVARGPEGTPGRRAEAIQEPVGACRQVLGRNRGETYH